MNSYEAEKKSRSILQKEIDVKNTELERLRAELKAVTAQPQTHEQSQHIPMSSQQRVDEVEAELEALRQSFAMEDQQDPGSWDHVPRISGPSSDGGDTILIHEDDDAQPLNSHQPSQYDTDVLSMGLELEAARQAKSSFLGSFREANTSFDFHFADSPARPTQNMSLSRIPDTPKTFHHDLSKRLKETTRRAEDAELALTALDIEITGLGFGQPETDDTLAMVAAISAHFREVRLELERLVPGETAAGFENSKVLPELVKKLRMLSQKLKGKEAELKASKDQHHNLKGNFEKAIIAAEKVNERVKELENALDAQAEDTLHIRMRSQQLEKDLMEKEQDVTSLGRALNKYRDDITRLEKLIDDIQTEQAAENGRAESQTKEHSEKIEQLEARIVSEQTGRRAAEVSAIQRLARINELETTLATTKRNSAELEIQLTALQSSTTTSSQDRAAEIGALNVRISSLATALASANAEVEKLKIIKNKLEERVRSEAEQGAKAVETLQEQLIRTVMKGNEARKRYVNGAKVRIANWELNDEREFSSDGAMSEDSGLRTPSTASVRFAEWTEVETIERIGDEQQQEMLTEDSGSESVPGSVEVQRGRGRYKKPRLVSYENPRRTGEDLGITLDFSKARKRRFDSGVGMSPSEKFEDVMEDTDCSKSGRNQTGMLTPELSSDVGVDGELVEDVC